VEEKAKSTKRIIKKGGPKGNAEIRTIGKNDCWSTSAGSGKRFLEYKAMSGRLGKQPAAAKGIRFIRPGSVKVRWADEPGNEQVVAACPVHRTVQLEQGQG